MRVKTPKIESPKSFKPIVSSWGYGDANIYFLGGHPLSDDVRNGTALSGFQEATLNSFLRPYKLTTKNCYSSVFIREKLDYSGTNPKKLRAALEKIDINGYLDLLFDDIKSVNPNVIVPLDDLALAAVFPHINQISKPKGRKHWVYCYRGSVLPLREDFQVRLTNTIRVIPTLGPQLLMNDNAARAFTSIDYKRINEEKHKRSLIQEYGLIWVAKTAIEVQRFFERGLSKNDGFVTFDIETYGGMVTCISFCFDGFESCSIPLMDRAITLHERAFIWQLVAKLLTHPIIKCGQNVKYDWTILERHGFNCVNVLNDTMLKASLLYADFSKALDFLTSIYTPIAYYKDEGKEFNPHLHSRDRLYLYNAKDSLATHIVNKKQEEELIESGAHKLYHEEVAPLLLIYKNIDEAGILIDNVVKDRLLDKYVQFYNSNLSILRGFVNNQAFNPKSPAQVGTLLYEELRYPKRVKMDEFGKSAYRTDKDTLDDLLINHGENNKLGQLGYNIISRVIVCRKLAKIIEYINTPLYPDNTFRGVSNLGGTSTGRTSFSKGLDESFLMSEEIDERRANRKAFKTRKRLGRSLQTISKHGFTLDDEIFDGYEDSKIAYDLRSMFVPSRGYYFIEGDGSQAEARVVCVLAEDFDLLATYDLKPKVHARTAAAIFDFDVNKITKDYPSVPKIGITYYDIGKRARHAGNLDIGDFRLAQMTHLPRAECARILDKFHSSEPKIRGTFHSEIRDKVLKTRTLINPFRRRRVFFDKITEHLYKEALAQIPQSTISDLTKFTMPRIVEGLDGYMKRYKFLTEQHDGILALVHGDIKEKYADVFKAKYERMIDFNACTLSRDFQLTIPAEMSWSNESWMGLTEI